MQSISEKRSGKIANSLYAISILPLLVFGIVIAIMGSYLMQRSMCAEVEEELSTVAETFLQLWDHTYPGDYSLRETTGISIYKGETNITRKYELLDELKERTGLDVTIFYQDTRLLTTIYNSNNERLVGTGAAQRVKTDVLEGGNATFYRNTRIYNTPFFSYYMPIKNSDGEVVGMLFIGKNGLQVNEEVNAAIYPLIITDILVMVIMMLIIFRYAKGVAVTLGGIDYFLKEAAKGNSEVELSPVVTMRNDELGTIGTSVVEMHRALRDTMDKDPLTGLNNRRSTYRKAKTVIARAEREKSIFSVAICDIDFFKKVNDTYGHDAGDEVLKKVADKLQHFMKEYGFVSRWGGEEFLLIFDHADGLEAEMALNRLLQEIRDMEIPYHDQVITVTMSFGVCTAEGNQLDPMTKAADERLYYAKKHGRNRVVRVLPETEETKVEETKVEETKVEETKVEEIKAEEVQREESNTDKTDTKQTGTEEIDTEEALPDITIEDVLAMRAKGEL